MAKAKTEKETTSVDQPEKVTLAAPYAYFDDENILHSWNTGTEVTDKDQITDLISRLAPLQEFPESF